MTTTFHLIPHVHWDREWYLSRSGHLARLVPMMDGLLELLESDPALRFHLDGQMVLVADYLELVPDARGTIEALVRRGQLGIGPWYVLADELMPSGRSLRKNLEIGIELARGLGGEVPVLYSPDAFGHPAGLPSLALDAGIHWGVVWRGLAGKADLRRWAAEDGRSILLHHLPPEGYEIGIDLVAAGAELPGRWRRIRRRLLERAVTSEVAVFVGADHHAPDPALSGLVAAIQALEPEATVRFSGLVEYFRAVEQAIGTGASLATVTGELRNSAGHAWSLQGTFSSRARLKRAHDRAASRLELAEQVARGRLDPAGRATLRAGWRRLVEAEFHDTICGCCADAVAAEQGVRLDGVVALASQVLDDTIDRLAGNDRDLARRDPPAAAPVLVAVNPGEGSRSGVVVAETTWFETDVLVGPPGSRIPREGLGYRAFHLISPDGTPVPLQVLRVAPGLERIDAPRHYPDLDQVDRVWVAAWLGPIEGRTAVRYQVADGALEPGGVPNPVVVGTRSLDNGLLAVTADRAGLVVTDPRDRRRHRGVATVVSEADRGDLYTPDIVPGSARRATITGGRLIAAGPLVGAIESRWTVAPAGGGAVHGRTVASLQAGDGALRITVEWDNWAANHRLRLGLPLGFGAEVDAGAPIGVTRRGVGAVDRRWADEAQLATAPARDFIASVDRSPPIRVECDGFVEYQLDRDGSLWITLSRSVGELSRLDNGNRRGHAGWPMATPAAQEPGRHRVELAIRFDGGVGTAGPIARWLRMASR